MSHEASEMSGTIDEKRRRLLACIDRVLIKLGPDVRRVLTYYMRREYELKHYEIPDKPQEFSRALARVFGKAAVGIEYQMIQLIVDEFHLEPETKLSLERVIQIVLSDKK